MTLASSRHQYVRRLGSDGGDLAGLLPAFRVVRAHPRRVINDNAKYAITRACAEVGDTRSEWGAGAARERLQQSWRSKRIGIGQRTHRAGKVARRARVDHHYRRGPRSVQRARGFKLVAAGGLQHGHLAGKSRLSSPATATGVS